MASVLDAIGNTPLVNVDGVMVKLEYLNPSGSVKDRIARYIVEKAEQRGELKKGYTMAEATSGNTGIAFSMVAALKGYKMTVVMPRGLSRERAQIMKGYGAKVIYVKKDCFYCAIEKVEKLGKRKNVFLPRQFSNVWNVEEHEKGMGREIMRDAKRIDAFVAGVGTGGTLIGVGRAIEKKFPRAELFALEPDECSMLASSGIDSLYHHPHNNMCRHHGIEGIGDGIVPEIVKRDKEMIDGVVEINTREAIAMARRLARRGYFVGPSSGANFLAALKLKKKYKHVVTLFPDRGDRYLSEGIFG